jgi:hypothetical protein
VQFLINANYAQLPTRAGWIEWAIAKYLIDNTPEKRMSAPIQCTLTPEIVSILKSELSPEEKAVWGANKDGTPYCVADIYQLVYVDKEMLAHRKKQLAEFCKQNPDHDKRELLMELIERMPNFDHSLEEEGWALVSKISLPKSEILHDQLEKMNCVLPSSLLVYTYLLDNALTYSHREDIQDFSTVTVNRRQLKVPGLNPQDALLLVCSQFCDHDISLTNNRLVEQKSTGFLAVRRWNLPASS